MLAISSTSKAYLPYLSAKSTHLSMIGAQSIYDDDWVLTSLIG